PQKGPHFGPDLGKSPFRGVPTPLKMGQFPIYKIPHFGQNPGLGPKSALLGPQTLLNRPFWAPNPGFGPNKEPVSKHYLSRAPPNPPGSGPVAPVLWVRKGGGNHLGPFSPLVDLKSILKSIFRPHD